MELATASAGHLLWAGLRSAAFMVWATFWPLVLGFGLSGAVRAFVPTSLTRRALGRTNLTAVARATALGVVSSSCSYAASATAHSLRDRGATFTNATVFMIASTNLVVELGLVIWVLLGAPFVLGEFIGGLVMIALVALWLPHVVPARRLSSPQESPPEASTLAGITTVAGWARAARFAVGDVRMLWRELAIGFLGAGFLAADVPPSAWHWVFLGGSGFGATLENVAVAPVVAVTSFVCSVGNVPLAAALWARGVALGGVLSFLFADLVAFPLLLVYRRFYGTAVAARLGVTLWVAMATAGVAVNELFRATGVHASRQVLIVAANRFTLGPTFALDVIAVVVAAALVALARRPVEAATAVDPVCGMQVECAHAAAHREVDGATYYFCAPRCAERFSAEPEKFVAAAR
jgi:uncharacterized protein